MEERDRRRWDTADENRDGYLNKFEFKHFLHPEESDHMREIGNAKLTNSEISR